MSDKPGLSDFSLDPAGLYREETVSDGRAGSIRCLHPILPDGSTDPSRAVLFQGQAQVMTPMGVLPVHFEIPASTLADAVQAFGAAARQGLDETLKELQEMRRQQASSIMVPGGGMGGGTPPGGGGKIQLY